MDDFIRLLDEINAVGLTDEQMKIISSNMNLEPSDIRQIMNRAAVEVEAQNTDNKG